MFETALSCGIGLQEEKEVGVYPIPGLCADLAAPGEPGRQQQDGHGGCPLSG